MVEWMHEVDSYVRVGGSLDIEKMWDDVECTFWNNKQIIDRITTVVHCMYISFKILQG